MESNDRKVLLSIRDLKQWFPLGKGIYNVSSLAEKIKKGGYEGDFTLEAFQTAEYTDISAFLSDGKARLEQIFG